jgi:Xaa-Pro aminopeptidase
MFRQESCFSYFFGLNEPNLSAIVDIEERIDYLFGDDIDIEDIIWMGTLPGLNKRGTCAGISSVRPSKDLSQFIVNAREKGRQIHFLPPYRHDIMCELEELLNIPRANLNASSSLPLKKAVIELRSVKDELEIAEIEKMVDVAWLMHVHAMEMAIPGLVEKEIAGAIEGIALSNGNGVSFPVILTTNGQTLHNHSHDNFLQKGRLLLTDAGAESEMLYASDITRTIPVSGTFSPVQKDIYNIVLGANLRTIEITGPQTSYRDVHLEIARFIASGLKDLGFMKGNVEDAVEAGAHALFFPHGLGHMLGMDVHDMEGLGEDLVDMTIP